MPRPLVHRRRRRRASLCRGSPTTSSTAQSSRPPTATTPPSRASSSNWRSDVSRPFFVHGSRPRPTDHTGYGDVNKVKATPKLSACGVCAVLESGVRGAARARRVAVMRACACCCRRLFKCIRPLMPLSKRTRWWQPTMVYCISGVSFTRRGRALQLLCVLYVCSFIMPTTELDIHTASRCAVGVSR